MGRLATCLLVVGLFAMPMVASVGSSQPVSASVHTSAWQNGEPGFITQDGLFFVEVGAPSFLGLFTPSTNGSQLYTYSVELNITSLVSENATANVKLYDLNTSGIITSITVPVTGYGNQFVSVTLPTEHTWQEVRVSVDGTPGYFWWETPYTWLPIPNLANGGIVLSVVLAFAVYLWIAYPLGLKARRMTRRAVYCPEWKAAWWLHGLVIGELAIYAEWFSNINMAFHGWEVFLFPLPEAFFVFFWTAGQHSRKIVVRFKQPVTLLGRPLTWIERKFYGGIDPEGNIVLIPYGSRSMFQWWFRSRGKHVTVWALFEDGRPATPLSDKHQTIETTARPAKAGAKTTPTEPLIMPVYDYESLTAAQLRDPARLPASGIYDQFKGAAVIGGAGGGPSDMSLKEDDETVSYEFVTPNLSDFRIKWPYAVLWSFETIQAYVDDKGKEHPAKEKRHFKPHIEPGSAQVTLMSWHGQDAYSQGYGWIESEDLIRENDDLRRVNWALSAQLQRESSRKAEESTLANRDILERPDTDLDAAEIEALIDRFSESKKSKRALPSGDAG